MPTRLFDPNIFDPAIFDTEEASNMPSPNSVTATANVDLRWKNTGTDGMNSISLPGSFPGVTNAFAAGNGTTTALQLDEIYQAQRTLAAGANETLDLAGSITGQISGTVDFARVKVIAIQLPATKADGSNQSSRIDVGGAATHPWLGFLADSSDKLKILKGMTIVTMAPTLTGMTVTAGSADKLFVENKDGSNAALYNIVLLGNQQ